MADTIRHLKRPKIQKMIRQSYKENYLRNPNTTAPLPDSTFSVLDKEHLSKLIELPQHKLRVSYDSKRRRNVFRGNIYVLLASNKENKEVVLTGKYHTPVSIYREYLGSDPENNGKKFPFEYYVIFDTTILNHSKNMTDKEAQQFIDNYDINIFRKFKPYPSDDEYTKENLETRLETSMEGYNKDKLYMFYLPYFGRENGEDPDSYKMTIKIYDLDDEDNRVDTNLFYNEDFLKDFDETVEHLKYLPVPREPLMGWMGAEYKKDEANWMEKVDPIGYKAKQMEIIHKPSHEKKMKSVLKSIKANRKHKGSEKGGKKKTRKNKRTQKNNRR